MEDPEATCSALLAYTNAVLTEEATVNESVNSVEDALSDNVLLAAVGTEHSLQIQYDRLQVLKIVYHQLILDHEQAYRLPWPNLDALASPEPPSTEFVKLYSIILLRQAVWCAENSRYVRIIQGLDQKYQECLKEVIEHALKSIPEPTFDVCLQKNKGDDNCLREAELLYNIQKQAVRAGENADVHRDLDTTEGLDSVEAEIPPLVQTPCKRNKAKRASVHRPSTPLKDKDNTQSKDASTDAAPIRNGESDPPRTPRSQRMTANERIQELQIERLQADLNDKAEELRDLEAQLDESRRNEQAYAHRIAELEEAVEELDRLRDEVEINRHDAEKLRKSETMADKLKKKLEAVEDMRFEIQALESQVQTLQDENDVWESKYTELFRSHEPKFEPPPTPSVVMPAIDEIDAEKTVQLAEYSVLVQQLEVALQAKDAEIAQLRKTAFERDDGAVDFSGSPTDEEGTVSEYRVTSPTRAQASSPTEQATSDSLDTQASLLRRIEELEALLAAATATAPPSADATFPPIRLSTDGRPEWEGAQTKGEIANLERDIIKLRVRPVDIHFISG
ncbi:hypothetical protein NCC49_001876 [Naganishia albida]|nr:hypothetical protein NCC49_001876 [Naganishia albida]